MVKKKYDDNYKAKGEPDPAAHLKNPSATPHIGRVLKFERTLWEAWREYQDEVNQVINERHAIRIQARARGMLDRTSATRAKVQQEKSTFIQKHVRAWLARKRLRETKRQYQVITLFASAERKAVMKLELAYIRRRERQRGFAAHIVQAHWHGRKARKQVDEEVTKRKLVYLMAKGQTKAAMRIQYAWWQYRAKVAERRKVAEARVVHAQVAEDERLQREALARESAEMEMPVWKKARSAPWIGYQERRMSLQADEGKLYYWNPTQQKRREILLRDVVGLTPELERASGQHMITLEVRKSAGSKAGKFALRFETEAARDTWLRRLRRVCHNVIDSGESPGPTPANSQPPSRAGGQTPPRAPRTLGLPGAGRSGGQTPRSGGQTPAGGQTPPHSAGRAPRSKGWFPTRSGKQTPRSGGQTPAGGQTPPR